MLEGKMMRMRMRVRIALWRRRHRGYIDPVSMIVSYALALFVCRRLTRGYVDKCLVLRTKKNKAVGQRPQRKMSCQNSSRCMSLSRRFLGRVGACKGLFAEGRALFSLSRKTWTGSLSSRTRRLWAYGCTSIFPSWKTLGPIGARTPGKVAWFLRCFG